MSIIIILQINDSIFSSNWRDSDGGVIYISGVDLKLCNSQFINNMAKNGGAIHSSYSLVLINNTVFLDNRVNELGGAIYSFNSQVSVYNSLFEKNSAQISGGDQFKLGSCCSLQRMHLNLAIQTSKKTLLIYQEVPFIM